MSLSKYFIAAVLVVACDQNKSGETTTTGATITPLHNGPALVPNDVSALAAGTEIGSSGSDSVNDAAIERMTSARCVHALACNNVGGGKKWTNDDACRRELRQTVRADFNADVCPGLRDDKVEECVESVQAEACDAMLGPSFGACLKTTICN